MLLEPHAPLLDAFEPGAFDHFEDKARKARLGRLFEPEEKVTNVRWSWHLWSARHSGYHNIWPSVTFENLAPEAC